MAVEFLDRLDRRYHLCHPKIAGVSIWPNRMVLTFRLMRFLFHVLVSLYPGSNLHFLG